MNIESAAQLHTSTMTPQRSDAEGIALESIEGVNLFSQLMDAPAKGATIFRDGQTTLSETAIEMGEDTVVEQPSADPALAEIEPHQETITENVIPASADDARPLTDDGRPSMAPHISDQPKGKSGIHPDSLATRSDPTQLDAEKGLAVVPTPPQKPRQNPVVPSETVASMAFNARHAHTDGRKPKTQAQPNREPQLRPTPDTVVAAPGVAKTLEHSPQAMAKPNKQPADRILPELQSQIPARKRAESALSSMPPRPQTREPAQQVTALTESEESKRTGIPTDLAKLEVQEKQPLPRVFANEKQPMPQPIPMPIQDTKLAATGLRDGATPEGAEVVVQQVRESPNAGPQQLQAASVAAQNTARNIAQQLAATITRQDANRSEIQLNPKELGNVRMQLVVQDTTINMTILAERQETQDLMRRHVETLTEEFRQMGYSAINLSFGDDRRSDDTGSENAQATAGPDDTVIIQEPAPQPIATSGLDLRL